MARVGDLEGSVREGVYLDPDGLRDLIRQLHGILLVLDGMGAAGGEVGEPAARFGTDGRLGGVGYLVNRNGSTLVETRKAVLGLAMTYRGLLRGAVRLIHAHTGVDADGSRDLGNAGG